MLGLLAYGHARRPGRCSNREHLPYVDKRSMWTKVLGGKSADQLAAAAGAGAGAGEAGAAGAEGAAETVLPFESRESVR